MKHLVLPLALIVSAASLVVRAAQYKDLRAAINSGAALESGVYELSSNLSYGGDVAKSALTIAEGQTVVIYLKNNATLSLKGGVASGEKGAGAGICLPATSSLYVTGEGTLVATGGNAYGGGHAEFGSSAYVTQKEPCENDGQTHSSRGGSFVNGTGGRGGFGGGGAGAGIGGMGGTGGMGGSGGTGGHVRYDHAKEFHMNGADGGDGQAGGVGGSAGKFYVLGSVVVKATGGAAGANGMTSSSYGNHYVKLITDDWLAAGGAPSGAGQGGGAGEAIGFGGAGGAGGGGGGAGGFFQFDDIGDDTGHDCGGGACANDKFKPGRGRNGWEGNAAEAYQATEFTCYDGSAKIGSARGGHGGKAGALAKNGTSGELHATPTTSLTLKPARAVEQLANVADNLPAVTLTFKDGDKEIGTRTVALGAAFPTPPDSPAHAGEVFLGWFLKDLCCYDAASIALLSASPLMENVTLQAKWAPAASILEVTDLDGFRKAIQALAADSTLVDKAGQRRVTFKDNPEIELTENLEIPESVGKLQLYGPATFRAESGTELTFGCDEVGLENLTVEKIKVRAIKLTLFNVAVRASEVLAASPLLASSTTIESVRLEGRGLLVNTTVKGVTVEAESDFRFVNVTQVGGAEISAERFINSLSVPAGTELKEMTLLGVTQKYVEPSPEALEGAVDIYYEPTGENIAKMENGEKVAITGHAALATRRLSLDQLGSVRKTPTKGAIRLISEQPTLAIEAKTDEGYVTKKVPVDYAATSVDIPDGSASAEVVTTPYALVASTVDVLNAETDLNIAGEAVVAIAEASGLVATNLVVNGESFSANSLDGMRAITLEDAALEGGELQWFGSANLVKADLNEKTFSGGRDFKKTDPLTVSAYSRRTETLASVSSDALAQIAVTTLAKPGVKLKVVSSGYEWTDSVSVGSSGKTVTKIYTIPLKAGESAQVEITNGSNANVTFTLSAQYIYFGVEE